jgi:hypothetical protein
MVRRCRAQFEVMGTGPEGSLFGASRSGRTRDRRGWKDPTIPRAVMEAPLGAHLQSRYQRLHLISAL